VTVHRVILLPASCDAGKKGPFEIYDHIIFRSFLEQQDLFAFGSFASLLSVLWLKTRKNNKKMSKMFLSEI
jgi:hypothetical protein